MWLPLMPHFLHCDDKEREPGLVPLSALLSYDVIKYNWELVPPMYD